MNDFSCGRKGKPDVEMRKKWQWRNHFCSYGHMAKETAEASQQKG